VTDLARLMQNQTAGDPQTRRKWKRKSLHQLSEQLKPAHHVSPHTVGRLLAEQDYSLHVNYKDLDGRSRPERNAQFEYIQAQIGHCSTSTDKDAQTGDLR
jgi:hypothetical protein